MKKCPYCKAEIADDSHFCLYCMSSLEEKQVLKFKRVRKGRFILLISVIVVCMALAVTAVWFAFNRDDPVSISDTKDSADKVPDRPADAEENIINSGWEPLDTEENTVDFDQEPLDTEDNAISSEQGSFDTEEEIPEAGRTDPDTAQAQQTEEPDESAHDSDIYIYEEVRAGDNYNLFYAFPARTVVIVGVSEASADGEYVIPDTIDGKTVIGIMEDAFCGEDIKDTVKKVVLPACIRNVAGGAFGKCGNLSDIYFMGDSIYVSSNAFAPREIRNETLTIHCSYDCDDRYMRYYRDTYIHYDAEYEEWQP